MSKERIRADLHVHSRSSGDSLARPCQIELERERRRLERVAVTDHNTVAEVLRELKEEFWPSLILGEEILTSTTNASGERVEIVGLFLQEPIKPGLTIEETISQIDVQDGIVVIPHPFELWRHGMEKAGIRHVVDECRKRKTPVAIEVLNARSRAHNNHQALKLWENELKSEGVLATAGSDAHRIQEIGRAYVSLPPFQTREEFLEALGEVEIYGKADALETAYHRLINRTELMIGYSFLDLEKQIAEKAEIATLDLSLATRVARKAVLRMTERTKQPPSPEEFNRTLNGWGERYFFHQPIEDISGLWFAVPDSVQIVFWFRDRREGKLIFAVKEKDLISLGYQPKEGGGFIIPFFGPEKAEYVDQISGPFDKVIRGQKITGITFKYLDKATSSIFLEVASGQISLKFAKGAEGEAKFKYVVERGRKIEKIMMPF